MPPIIAVGSRWPPGTAGKGNQPRSGSGFWFGGSVEIVPGSQAPMSSMPALWLATRPAEEPAPTLAAGEVVGTGGRGPRVLGADRDRVDVDGLQLGDIGLELRDGGRRRGDARLLEEVLAVVDPLGLLVQRDGVNLAVKSLAGERGRADIGLVRGGEGKRRDLVRVDHGEHLAAAALEEDVRRRVRGQRGLQLAVVVLVLDGLHLDRHAGVGRVEGLDGVLEERKAGARGCVRPEGQRDGAGGGRAIAAVAAAAATRAGGGGQDDAEAECGYRRSGGFLHHRRNSLTENWVPRLLRRRSAGAAATARLLRMVISWDWAQATFESFRRTFDVPSS